MYVSNPSLLFTVPEDVIKQEMDSLEVAARPAPSPAPFSLKKELGGSGTSASTPARARGRPRKTKPGSLQPRHLKSPGQGQGSEQPSAQLQPKIQPHPQLQAQPQLQPQPQLQLHPQPQNGFLEPEGSPLSLGQSQHDLSQSAFLSWLSQTQSHGSLLSSSVLTPDSSPGKLDPTPSQPLEEPEPDEAEPIPDSQAPWFSLAQMPCNAAPTPPPAVSEDQPTLSPQQPASSKPVSSQKSSNAIDFILAQAPLPVKNLANALILCFISQMSRPSAASPCSPVQLSSTPLPGMASKRRIGDPGGTSQSLTGAGQPKRRGRPPSKFFKQMEQRYLTQLTAQPVPPGECP